MAIYNKSAEPAPVAARLNLLEEKVRNIAPGEGEDLTSVIAALNRIYDMCLRGGTHGTNPEGDVDGELGDSLFWFRQQSFSETARKSIVTVTFGDTDGLDRVKDIPLLHQVLGVDVGWTFAKPSPSDNQNNYSLAGTIFSSPSDLSDIRARRQTILGLMFGGGVTTWQDFIDAHGSIFRAIYGNAFSFDPDASTKSLLSIIRSLEAKIVDLEDRVQWLEDH